MAGRRNWNEIHFRYNWSFKNLYLKIMSFVGFSILLISEFIVSDILAEFSLVGLFNILSRNLKENFVSQILKYDFQYSMRSLATYFFGTAAEYLPCFCILYLIIFQIWLSLAVFQPSLLPKTVGLKYEWFLSLNVCLFICLKFVLVCLI